MTDGSSIKAASLADGRLLPFQRSTPPWLRAAPGWLGLLLLAALTWVPLAVVLTSFLHTDASIWAHLRSYVLPDVLRNTLYLVLGVSAGTLLLGVPLAWLTTQYRFPGQRSFAWALMLPLAMPAYVLAFCSVGLLEYTGPLQTALRAAGWDVSHWLDVRSLPGAVLVLSLAFYPYVYLLARQAFLSQGSRAQEAARVLGLGRWAVFRRVALPMAWPWIAGGWLLALMETLADFGAVSVFNLDTFTTAIYKSWFALFSLPTAQQLASLLVGLVLLLVAAEHFSRGARAYHVKSAALQRQRLHGWAAIAATVCCGSVLVLSFLLPLGQLIYWASQTWATELDSRYWQLVGRSLLLAALAASLLAATGILLAVLERHHPGRAGRWLVRMATMGYAVPGSVLAVGVFVPVAWLDNQLLPLLHEFGFSGRSLFKGTVAIMLFALLVRFLAVAYQPIASAMARITRSQEEAARSLGLKPWQIVGRVYVPLLRAGVLTATMMCFVDVLKEMPLTLMTRTAGWDTLAIRVFEMTSEGMWDRAAIPACFIVAAGLLPVWLLTRQLESPDGKP